MTNRPKFTDLTPDERAQFGNGLGPWWFPDRLRNFITNIASFFFFRASWRHHDFGYAVGGDRYDRRRCDDKFLIAMLSDAITQARRWHGFVTFYIALFLAVLFYVAVRLGGHRSFEYRKSYATLDEVREHQLDR